MGALELAPVTALQGRGDILEVWHEKGGQFLWRETSSPGARSQLRGLCPPQPQSLSPTVLTLSPGALSVDPGKS